MFEAKLESYPQLVVLRKWKKFFETLQFLSINSWNSPFKIRKKKKKIINKILRKIYYIQNVFKLTLNSLLKKKKRNNFERNIE